MATATTEWEAKRRRMVEKQLRRRGIHDERVLDAMGRIPRELFVSESKRGRAYNDEPLTIGHNQTISQPYMTALMVQSLELRGDERVLEIGAGCGYHAAVLASLCAEVIAVEIVRDLAAAARRNLEAAGLGGKVTVVAGDGSLGYLPRAPYSAISVAAAAPRVPIGLTGQLEDPGRIVIPVGALDEQELLVITLSDGETSTRVATRCRFVPLLGGQGWRLN